MNNQQQEAQDYEAIGYDRFEGFDRGDLDRDYEGDLIAMWEADEVYDSLRAAA